MKKIIVNKTVLIMIITAALFIAVIVLGILNFENISERRLLQEGNTFLITAGSYTHTITKNDILLMDPKVISANFRDDIRNFTGVPIAEIFDFLDIEITNASTVILTSGDGFTTILTIDEALDRESAFVVFEEDGIELGSMEEDGDGPYMIVMAMDPFPNRWTKYLMEITIQ